MSRDIKERLYHLLPAIYRQRDILEGMPLRALLAVIENEVHIIQADIERLYENWFIETCDEWVVPYIGDLVGAPLLRSVENANISQRAYVAKTITYRRRKGTAFVLEQMTNDVTGWDARAVEFFQLLSTTQHINHRRGANVRTPDLRDGDLLELLDTPFDTIPHTVDVRNIRRGRGRHNIPNVGIFLWRLVAYPVKKARAFDHGEGRYSFSQVGYDMPLFNHPSPEPSLTNLAQEINVSTPIRRLAFKKHKTDYYGQVGDEKSILIEVDGAPIRPDDLVLCNLSDWKHRPPNGKVAIDPVLGRIAFPTDEKHMVYVTYYYGFSADIGGGFYRRDLYTDLPADIKTHQISQNGRTGYRTISEAIKQWKPDEEPHVLFEIQDSEFYDFEESLDLTLPTNTTCVIRAAQEQRPVLRANPTRSEIKLLGEENSSLILDGLLIDKSLSLKIKHGNLGSLRISHCTLVLGEDTSCELDGNNNSLTVTISRSITGRIVMKDSEAKLTLTHSIVDGKSGNADGVAIQCYEAAVETSTIFGKVNVDLLRLASNTIFTDAVTVKRRQEGCVRFSYIPNGSQVPRRYRCQPPASFGDAAGRVAMPVGPRFTSEKYGEPGYGQLHKDISREILEGADNEAEMGAFNHLCQSQRINNLKANYVEYLRFGLEAGIFMVT